MYTMNILEKKGNEKVGFFSSAFLQDFAEKLTGT